MGDVQFLKVPRNISGISYKDIRLYCRFLDLKAQAPDIGTFKIYHTKRAYQRDIKKMISKGWAWRESGKIRLKSYQYVWRSMGIQQQKIKGIRSFQYWKLPIDILSPARKTYLRQIETWIQKKMSERKRKQMIYAINKKNGRRTKGGALNETGKMKIDQATFSAKSSAILFGYKSPASGSKLRNKYFEVLPQSEAEQKEFWNPVHGRYEIHPRKIAL